MPAYLRCRVTGEAVSPIFLHDADLEAAQGGSELLVRDAFQANLAVFPPRRGIGWPTRTVDVFTPAWTAMKLRIYEREFFEACRGVPGQPAT